MKKKIKVDFLDELNLVENFFKIKMSLISLNLFIKTNIATKNIKLLNKNRLLIQHTQIKKALDILNRKKIL